MSNILYFDDFKKQHLSSAFSVETRFFEHFSANHNTCEDADKEEELHNLIEDIMPVLDDYFDHLTIITDIDELIESLQRVFVFLNNEIS